MNKYFSQRILSVFLLSLLLISCSNNSSSSPSSSPAPNAPFEITPTPADPTPPAPPVATPAPTPTDPVDDEPENVYDFTLNGGAKHTSGLELQLDLVAPVSVQSIKIGQSTDCSDGSIEAFKSNLVRPVFKRNAVNQVSVQYISFTGAIDACVVKSIVQDDQAPDIVISQYPSSSLEEGSSAELKYSVTDISAIKEVTCSLNNTAKSCTSGEGLVKVGAMSEGSYEFKIVATDEYGFSSSRSVSWEVVSSARHVTQVVDIKNDRKVDILIVVDNSASMEYEQRSMANRVSNMLGVLKGLDWQIAVTTTDPRNVALGDGRLIPINGTNGSLILKSSMDPNEAQSKLGLTLQRPEQGDSSEQPIRNTYRFIERALGSNSNYRSFFRDNSNFAVIVISDEDESDTQKRNDPTNLINLVSTSFNQQKVFSWHSIITKPNDQACKSTYGATYGVRLARFSQMTGGVIGSVCEADYAAQMTGIGNSIVSMNKSISLTCQPLAQFPIVIKKDGVNYTNAYVQEGLNLKFNEILAPGSYSVEYTCLK